MKLANEYNHVYEKVKEILAADLTDRARTESPTETRKRKKAPGSPKERQKTHR